MKKTVLWGLGIALVLAVFISPFASSYPDGLERVAEDKGFAEKAYEEPVLAAPIPDYGFSGVKSDGISTGLAGFLGTLVAFGAGYGLAVAASRSRAKGS